MKKTYTAAAIFIFSVLAVVACAGSQASVKNLGTESADNSALVSENSPSRLAPGAPKSFTMDFKAEPQIISAGTPAVMSFTVRDKNGAVVRDLPIVHEKPMHLLVVSKDLAEFYHIHPEQSEDGSYRVTHTFPNGGDYKLYADFTPMGSAQIVERVDVKVGGSERQNAALIPDQKLEKSIDGLKVVMIPDQEIKAGQELMLNFQAFDARTNKPATDLQNYLGELAHFVIISEDMQDFVHAHPMSKAAHNEMSAKQTEMKTPPAKADHNADGHRHDPKGSVSKNASASEVSAHTAFPRSGIYKVWAQFQRNGKVITVPFTVRAGEGKAGTISKENVVPADAVKVTVSSNGYEPSEIKTEKGKLVKLAFYRADANNCGGEIVFSKMNLRKKLPVGETVVVEFTPTETGEIGFACGMNMMKGKVITN